MNSKKETELDLSEYSIGEENHPGSQDVNINDRSVQERSSDGIIEETNSFSVRQEDSTNSITQPIPVTYDVASIKMEVSSASNSFIHEDSSLVIKVEPESEYRIEDTNGVKQEPEEDIDDARSTGIKDVNMDKTNYCGLKDSENLYCKNMAEMEDCIKTVEEAQKCVTNKSPRSRTSGSRGTYNCADCDKKFRFKRLLSKHIQREHKQSSKHIKLCTEEMQTESHVKRECALARRSKISRNKHQKVNKGKPWACDECDKIFIIKLDLKKHVIKNHSKSRYVCPHCSSQFTEKRAYNKHLSVYHKQYPYTCNYCSKEFAYKDNLSRHLKSHSEEDSYACDKCDKSFKCKENLVCHIKIHTGKNLHSCSVCKKTFTRKHIFLAHVRIHTEEKPYLCDTCGKAFRYKQGLDQHTRIHNNDNSYPCDRCDKTFKLKTHLNIHYRVHTGEKPFMCDVCGKRFTQQQTVITHKKLHNQD